MDIQLLAPNSTERGIIEAHCIGWGYQVTTYETATEFLSTIAHKEFIRSPIALVLLTLEEPTGPEVVQKLHRLCDIPTIFLIPDQVPKSLLIGLEKSPHGVFFLGTPPLSLHVAIVQAKERQMRKELLQNSDLRLMISIEMFRILNTPPHSHSELSQRFTTLLRRHIGLDAVALRIAKGGDFPYSGSCGFSEQFLYQERRLGGVAPECLCGMVVSQRGHNVEKNPLLTPYGSFFTGDIEALGETAPVEWLPKVIRNYCGAIGFHSVALIPLYTSTGVVGLLQLNDRRRNLFTDSMIHFLEDLSQLMGWTLLQCADTP